MKNHLIISLLILSVGFCQSKKNYNIDNLLVQDGSVNITIYDMMGRIVKTLVNSSQKAGYKSVQWNATNDRNESVSAGLYLYTIQAGEFRQTKKMVLLK